MSLDEALAAHIAELAHKYRPLGVEILKEAVRIPADYVDRSIDDGGDPSCGLSNHEGPRLEYLKRRIVEVGAVDSPEDVFFDDFGNLVWTVEDPEDGMEADHKKVIFLDGHTDTVEALRPRWLEATGGIDAYDGLVDAKKLNHDFLRSELGHLPPDDEWEHLVWGRGSADQLGGVVCQILATKILLELREAGALRGKIVRSYATVSEEDNDGGGPMHVFRHELAGALPSRIPDLVILTEGTGDREKGAVGIYRGQRGRMQIEVTVTGKSCHGSMPWEGRNPLEFGAAIIAEAAERYRQGDGFGDNDFLGPGSRTASWAVLDTPSDCAVPERFTFRFDRRLTAGEDPRKALADVEQMASVKVARDAGLKVELRAPVYEQPTWRGAVPGNPQIYPGWVTPAEHPMVVAAAEAYRRVCREWIGGDAGASSGAIAGGVGAGSGTGASGMGAAGGVGAGGGSATSNGVPGTGGGLRKEPRVERWIFSTDGVGMVMPVAETPFEVPDSKRWVHEGGYWHPPMFGVGPGIEQNTHKIGECVDSREFDVVVGVIVGVVGSRLD